MTDTSITPPGIAVVNGFAIIVIPNRETWLALVDFLLTSKAIVDHLGCNYARYYDSALAPDERARYEYEKQMTDKFNALSIKIAPLLDTARATIRH